MGKIILIAEFSNLSKPILVRLWRANKHLISYSVQNISSEPRYHPENGQLLQVEGSFSWQHTCQEEDYRVWGVGVELQQSLDSFLDMKRDGVSFNLVQIKSCKAREKDRRTIDVICSNR